MHFTQVSNNLQYLLFKAIGVKKFTVVLQFNSIEVCALDCLFKLGIFRKNLMNVRIV